MSDQKSEQRSPAQPEPKTAPPVVAGTRAPRPTARVMDDALWLAASPVTPDALRALRVFFHALPEASLSARFGTVDHAALVADAPTAVPALRRQSFRAELAVTPRRASTDVFIDEPEADGKLKFRLVWPLELGQGVSITPQKPFVNAGTGSPVLRRQASWLFDFAPSAGWLEQKRAAPAALKYRAVWKPVAARTSPIPVLMVRVVRWQVFDGETLLHEETDDR